MEITDINKLQILHYSLTLERMASISLGAALDIDDISKTLSLGSRGESLSFNQKVNLLIDYGAIEKEEKKILEIAMKIRNQFMHNYDCETYTDVLSHLEGVENRLRKIYPNHFKNEDNEKNLNDAIRNVFYDAINILSTIKGTLESKFKSIGINEMNKKIAKSFQNNIQLHFDKIFTEIQNNEFVDYDNGLFFLRMKKLYEDVLLGSLSQAKEEYKKENPPK